MRDELGLRSQELGVLPTFLGDRISQASRLALIAFPPSSLILISRDCCLRTVGFPIMKPVPSLR